MLSRYPYTPARGAPTDLKWPPKGIEVVFAFRAPAEASAEVKGQVNAICAPRSGLLFIYGSNCRSPGGCTLRAVRRIPLALQVGQRHQQGSKLNHSFPIESVEFLPKGGRPRGDRVCGEPEREPAVGRLRRLPSVVSRRAEGRGMAPRRDGRAARNRSHVGKGPRAAGTPRLISGIKATKYEYTILLLTFL